MDNKLDKKFSCILGLLILFFLPLAASAADISEPDYSAINKKVFDGNIKEVHEFIKLYPASVYETTEFGGVSRGVSHLIVSSFSSSQETLRMLKLFKAYGGDLNAPDQHGNTCLNAAIGNEKFELALELLSLGIDASTIGNNGRNALHFLAGASVKSEADQIRLAEALTSKFPTMVNSRDAAGRTPLHFSVEQMNGKFVQWLIDHGANSSIADVTGETPLDIARFNVSDADTEESREIAKHVLTILQKPPTTSKANL